VLNLTFSDVTVTRVIKSTKVVGSDLYILLLEGNFNSIAFINVTLKNLFFDKVGCIQIRATWPLRKRVQYSISLKDITFESNLSI
jgi:hypothetical protein